MTEAMVQPETENEVAEPLSPYQQARQLLEVEHRLDDKLLELEGELQKAQDFAGQEQLDAILSGDPVSSRGTLRTTGVASQVHGVFTAIRAARARRREALQQSYAVQGESLRAEAAKLRAEASERQAQLDKLKGALEAFEGVGYIVHDTRQQSDRPPIVGKTQALRDRAAALVAQAERRENLQVPDSGELTLGRNITIDELLAHFSNCVQIDPARHTLRAWLAETQAAPDPPAPRGSQILPGQNFTRLKLVWRDGEVVTAESGKRFNPPESPWA